MKGTFRLRPTLMALFTLSLFFWAVSAATSISIYTDSNVTTPSLTVNTVQIIVGGAYDNGQVDSIANMYPGLSTKASVQTFGKNTILVGCGPCTVGDNDIASAANSFTSSITIASNSALIYNGIQIVDLNGNALAVIVTGSYPTAAERAAAQSIASAIHTLTEPTTTTIQTTTITTTASTSIPATTTAQACPSFYYYNSTGCTPQTISPACPPNYPNSPTYFTCSGTSVNASICPSTYVFNKEKSQCILISYRGTTVTTTIIPSSTTTVPQPSQPGTDLLGSLINAILNFLKSFGWR
ncbi:MAG: hypothetical protein KGH54_02505 [Candidatus Micrarchaeota archaeon]|nr:hypothetical protein [Candidatus Micrarchaeota archaeon]